MSYLDDIAKADASTRLETLEEARAKADKSLTLDEYTLARMVYSEHASGSPTELVCLADAGANKAEAEGRSIYLYATNGSGYGAQGERSDAGGKRPVSTARAPTPRHVAAALAVLRGSTLFGLPIGKAPARGIAKGARRFFDPRTQDKLHQDYKAGRSGGKVHSCSALGLLKAWTFDRPYCGGSRCCSDGAPPSSGRNGSSQEEWVGPIEGVDPYELMLMRPKSALQEQLYAEAVKVIESRGSYKGHMPIGLPPAVVHLALLVVGLSIAARAGGLV